MIPIKILSQRPILSADLFTVIETKLDVKGKIHTHCNIFRPPIASVFPLTDDGQIFLIRQYRYLHGETFLEEVAGHIEEGESPIAAARRELQEEIGMKAEKWKKFGTFAGTSSVVKTRIHLFIATELTLGTASPEEDEEITLVKMPLSEAVESVLSGKIKNSIASLGILLIHAMKQRGEI